MKPHTPSTDVSAKDSPTTTLNEHTLRRWPLPLPADDGDKEVRGRLLIVAGSREMPGALILAANAALRAGAGKLVVATGASVAPLVAAAIPEARVIGLPETHDFGIDPIAVKNLESILVNVDAVLIGPGMQDEPAICRFVFAIWPKLASVKLVLDAAAMGIVRASEDIDAVLNENNQPPNYRELVERCPVDILLTPHAGEMAHLTGLEKREIKSNPGDAAKQAAHTWNAVVALKGATTHIATPRGEVWQHDGGNIGLAVSGSGDVLAGVIAGLACRGASLEQAAAWGVALHAQAGEKLSSRFGSVGFFAREIADEIPMLMHALTSQPLTDKLLVE